MANIKKEKMTTDAPPPKPQGQPRVNPSARSARNSLLRKIILKLIYIKSK